MNNVERLILTPEYLASQGLSQSFPERFFRRVVKTSPCWIWDGGVGGDGYGVIRKGADKEGCILAHRASWILHFGPIPDGLCVLHGCIPGPDNKLCVRPEHLHLGTDTENRHEAVVKKQFCQGERHPRAFLSWDQVREIRRLSLQGMSNYAIARQMNMSPNGVHGIVHFRTWKE
jgi:hypothetical protein